MDSIPYILPLLIVASIMVVMKTLELALGALTGAGFYFCLNRALNQECFNW